MNRNILFFVLASIFLMMTTCVADDGQSAQFKIRLIIRGDFSPSDADTLWFGVSGDGPDGAIRDNTYECDWQSEYGDISDWREQYYSSDPNVNEHFCASFVDVPGRTPGIFQDGLTPNDFRGFTSANQVDSFAIRIAGDHLVEESIVTISWPNVLYLYGTYWELRKKTGPNWNLVVPDMRGTESYADQIWTISQETRYLLIKTGALSLVPPAIICPETITVNNDPDQCSAVVPFSVTATGSPAPEVVCKVDDTPISSPHTFPVGTTTVNCTATNILGSASCSFTVTVNDNQLPTISISLDPASIWKDKNDKMVPITATVDANDNCSCNCDDRWIQAKNISDGDTLNGIDIFHFWLKAQPAHRIYTVTYTAKDGAGNTNSASATVTVDNKLKKDSQKEDQIILPEIFNVEQNYPNPFNPITTIRFTLPAEANVRLAVYNTLGQKVVQLADQYMSAGHHNIVFDASKFPSGVYFYRFESGSDVQVKKLLLLK